VHLPDVYLEVMDTRPIRTNAYTDLIGHAAQSPCVGFFVTPAPRLLFCFFYFLLVQTAYALDAITNLLLLQQCAVFIGRCVCVCAYMRACVRACACMCLPACVSVSEMPICLSVCSIFECLLCWCFKSVLALAFQPLPSPRLLHVQVTSPFAPCPLPRARLCVPACRHACTSLPP
jgi:hypothetical protein